MKKSTILLFTSLLTFSSCIFAGPIRDKLMERHHAREINQRNNLKVIKDVSYGKDNNQKMDIYLPDTANNSPIVLMVHGGGWYRGDKEMQTSVENKKDRWTSKGIIFISIDYRMIPEADPAVQAQDVAKALSYVQNHASQWGGNFNEIILMGHSAGAHLVSLISANPQRYSNLKPWLSTISLDSGAYDVTLRMTQPHPKLFDNAFGKDPEFWKITSPINFITSNAPPMLLVCSTQRSFISCGESEIFQNKAKQLGVRVELLKEDLTHKQINDNLGLDNSYTRDVERFMSSLAPGLNQRLN